MTERIIQPNITRQLQLVKCEEYRNLAGQVRRNAACGLKLLDLVPEAGLEPAHPVGHWSLKPARLPIPPLRQNL